MGLKVNPYDPCASNRIVCGTQQTIVWHVDDLKLPHLILREKTKIIQKLMKIYGKDMTVCRGKKHRYLGMDMDWSVKVQLMIDMSEYNKETVSIWPEPLEKPVKTPSGEHLLKVNVDCAKLDDKRARLFHTLTARNLFVRKRARGYIPPTTTFFTTRVKESDKDDWKKLGRCL